MVAVQYLYGLMGGKWGQLIILLLLPALRSREDGGAKALGKY